MLLLIMLRIIALLTRNQHKTSKLGMNKLAVAAFTAGNFRETGGFQVRNELADLTRHGPRSFFDSPILIKESGRNNLSWIARIRRCRNINDRVIRQFGDLPGIVQVIVLTIREAAV